MCCLSKRLDSLAQGIDVGTGAVGIDSEQPFEVGRCVSAPCVCLVDDLAREVKQVGKAVFVLEMYFVDDKV